VKKNVSKEFQNLFSRVLIAIIFVLISTIYIYWSEESKEMVKKNLFETSLSFTAINDWYEKEFGKVIPIDLNKGTTPVTKNSNDFLEATPYQNGVSVKVSKDTALNALNSGIVVFIGEKENYGNTVIIEQIDGIDTFYSNISINDIKLYDYMEKGELLGEAKDNKLYLSFQKDGKYLDYQKYL